jgi:hypothetical protein
MTPRRSAPVPWSCRPWDAGGVVGVRPGRLDIPLVTPSWIFQPTRSVFGPRRVASRRRRPADHPSARALLCPWPAIAPWLYCSGRRPCVGVLGRYDPPRPLHRPNLARTSAPAARRPAAPTAGRRSSCMTCFPPPRLKGLASPGVCWGCQIGTSPPSHPTPGLVSPSSRRPPGVPPPRRPHGRSSRRLAAEPCGLCTRDGRRTCRRRPTDPPPSCDASPVGPV